MYSLIYCMFFQLFYSMLSLLICSLSSDLATLLHIPKHFICCPIICYTARFARSYTACYIPRIYIHYIQSFRSHFLLFHGFTYIFPICITVCYTRLPRLHRAQCQFRHLTTHDQLTNITASTEYSLTCFWNTLLPPECAPCVGTA